MNKIFIALLFFSNCSFAQFYDSEKAIPGYFNNFVKDKEIEWAVSLDDTVSFSKINLSEILRKRFDNNEIKVTVPFLKMDSIVPKKMNYASRIDVLRFGALPQSTEDNTEENNHAVFDSISSKTLDIQQIFYIEDGILKVYVPFVSPKKNIVTPGGTFLGYGDYFLTGFNYKYEFQRSKKDKVIELQQTTRKVTPDSMAIPYRSRELKQVFGKNLIETLWPYMISGKLEVLDAVTNKKISIEELKQYRFREDNIEVPIFDSTGMLLQKEKDYASVNISGAVFKEIDISQDWFYNESKNIVYSTIPQIILYARRFKNSEPSRESSPVFKIIFK